ncbi:MAG TPA: hypothetical protein VNB23_14625 [Ramlibacter sp.]|nr:hypothetical protein [Ramlibacter sp.]
MSSHPEGATAPCPTETPPALAQASPAELLAQASRALWAATLSLMTAFMQTAAPAHRYLLAQRISRNFDTLSRQDCFDARCRASFARLADRWARNAQQHAPEGVAPPKSPTLLARLFS